MSEEEKRPNIPVGWTTLYIRRMYLHHQSPAVIVPAENREQMNWDRVKMRTCFLNMLFLMEAPAGKNTLMSFLKRSAPQMYKVFDAIFFQIFFHITCMGQARRKYPLIVQKCQFGVIYQDQQLASSVAVL